jgi:hypothetical protein
MSRSAQIELRGEVVRNWTSLGFLALAPIPLLSPIPCIPWWGIVCSVALATAPGFRLAAIRSLDALPASLRDGARRESARFMHTQRVEGILAICICVYALLATFGMIPAKFALLYRALVIAWWCVACAGLVAQLAYGDALVRRAEGDMAAQTDLSRTARRLVRVAFAIAVVGAAAAGLGWRLPNGDLSDFVAFTGLLLLSAASLTFVVAALRIRSHAELVGESLFESDVLAKQTITMSVAAEKAESDLDLPRDWKPPPPPPPRGGRDDDDDDAPIPLA